MLNSRIHNCLTTSLTPASPGALRSTKQQVSIPVFRDCVTLPLFREATRSESVTVSHMYRALQLSIEHDKDRTISFMIFIVNDKQKWNFRKK